MIFNSKQILYYLLVGIFAVFIDFIVYILLKDFMNLDPSISKRVSYVSGATFSFFLNKKLTFKSQKSYLKEILLFMIIYMISYFLNSYMHDLSYLYVKGYYPFFFALIISIIFNFLGQKFIVFRN